MAATTDDNLENRVRRFRGVTERLQHKNIPIVEEALKRIRDFLQKHETASSTDNTHAVFDNYVDWWLGKKSSFKLAIAEDGTIELLNNYIDECYKLGVPLTLAEKRTPEIKFVQDLCIWGTPTDTVTVEELFQQDGHFAHMLGRAIGEIYPQSESLHLVVFDATGTSMTKAVMKTSVRLVWPSLVVDKERALKIHDYVVDKFKDASEAELKELSQRALELNKENVWANIFSTEIYTGRQCVRMPLCDRVSPSPMKAPERRPFVPVCVLKFNYQEGALQTSERVVKSAEELDGHEWIKIGSIRCETGTPLTEWKEPVRKASGPGGTRSFLSAAGGVLRGQRSSGQVKVRTRSGSDNPLLGAVRRVVLGQNALEAGREADGRHATRRRRRRR